MFIRKKKLKSSGGFTLIEVMVTMAIVGAVAVIAGAGYLSWKPGYVLRGAVSQVRADLNRAKMRAVETRRECRVVFTTNGYQLDDGDQVMFTGAGGWTPVRVANFSTFPQISLTDGGGNAIVAATPTEPLIIFSPRGTTRTDLTTGSTNSLQIVHDTLAGVVTINVNITGGTTIIWP